MILRQCAILNRTRAVELYRDLEAYQDLEDSGTIEYSVLLEFYSYSSVSVSGYCSTCRVCTGLVMSSR